MRWGARIAACAAATLLLPGCGSHSAADQAAGPSAQCLALQQALTGTWRRSGGGSQTGWRFPDVFTLQDGGLFVSGTTRLQWSVAYTPGPGDPVCDSFMLVDGAGTLLITYNVNVQRGWLHLVNWGRDETYWSSGQPPVCPETVAVKHLQPVSLEQMLAIDHLPLSTGVGAYLGMEVRPAARPAGGTWNGAVVVEDVWPLTDPCNLASVAGQPAGYFCSCPTRPMGRCDGQFTVGNPFADPAPTGMGVAEPDVFWDLHAIRGNGSLLHQANRASCQVTCGQSYSCGGQVIGRFTITMTLTRDDAAHVTRVSVAKQ